MSKIAFSTYPKLVILEVTNRCNLNCFICVRESAVITPDFDINNISALKKVFQNTEVVQIAGFGEPFIYPHLQELLEYIYKNNTMARIQIITNGTGLSARKASWFKGKIDFFNISLNAANSERYAREMYPQEFASGVDVFDRFDRLLGKIRAFADELDVAERTKIHLSYIVHRDNYLEMCDFVKLTHDLGLKVINFNHYMVNKESNIAKSIFWIKDEYNDVLEQAHSEAKKLGITVNARKFYSEQKHEFIPDQHCRWVYDTVIIERNGRVIPCCYCATHMAGNLFSGEQSFEDIWFGKSYQKLREKRFFPACETCNQITNFDEIEVHFHPWLKDKFPKLFEEQKQGECLKQTIGAIFKTYNVDYQLNRHVLRSLQTGIPDYSLLSRLSTVEDFSHIENELWKMFLNTEHKSITDGELDLSDSFYGTGWGPSESNVHGQSWRWLGGHRGDSTVMLALVPDRSYKIRTEIHSANRIYLLTLKAKINDLEAKHQHISDVEGKIFHFCHVPKESLLLNAGKLKLSFTAGPPPGVSEGELGLSFSKMVISSTPLERPTDQTDSDICAGPVRIPVVTNKMLGAILSRPLGFKMFILMRSIFYRLKR